MLRDKVVFITGASSGLGAVIATEVAKRGAIVILTGRNQQRLNAITQSIVGECAAFLLDVTDHNQVEQVVTAVILKYGKIDILVNNAGYGQFVTMENMPLTDFSAMMDTNYMGVVRCTKAVLPYMLQQKQGQIINIASMAGKIGTAKSTAYSATKHAVLGFTNSLRAELRHTGITITAVNPGPISTDFFVQADPDGSYVKNVKWFMMTPEKVARKVVTAMLYRRTEIDMPLLAMIGIKLYMLMPRWADRLLGSMMNKK
ncbi:SDR family NAD(P)-dependent oxidoreductase [Paenibacillus yanchengensis]|uniref:SDR family NAD(P)-dependent oxidoreductase n=1 Tax=Paenibacillus yanchengensis TaxID=2035833 RepID=A0ABW4YLZ6_9BACL